MILLCYYFSFYEYVFDNMMENNVPIFKVGQVNDMLGNTFSELESQINQYLGQNISIKGKLLNVEEQLNKSRYASVYQLKVEDETGIIEVEIFKKYIADFKDGDYVELVGQPKFNLYNDILTKRFRAFSIKAAEADKDIERLRSDLDSFDKLKKFPARSIPFPDKQILKISVIYSSATNVKIAEDFYKHLSGYQNHCNFNEITVSLSDDLALSQAIDKSQGSDIVVLIRGGGSPEHFKIFNSDRVLDSFSKLDAYRVVGLGHNTDVTLLDYIVDHSAYTPLDAGIHLRDQIERVLSRDKEAIETISKLQRYQSENRYKDTEIQKLKYENQKLPSLQEVTKLRDEKAHLSAELNMIRNRPPETDNKMIAIIAVIAAIVGVILGKFML